MKKILLVLLLVVTHTNTFSQEGNKEINTSYHRFGMDILTIGYGYGMMISLPPLSFYLANDLQQIVSFGADYSITPYGGFQIGAHVGFGEMYASKSNKKLSLGYLMEFSAGGIIGPSSYPLPFYVDFRNRSICLQGWIVYRYFLNCYS